MDGPSRGLPANPHLAIPKKQARELLKQCKSKLTDALERVRRRHPKYKAAEDETLATRLKLSDAQLVIASEYGFSSWKQMKERIEGNTVVQLIDKGIRANDIETVTRLLTSHPALLNVPVWSGNWGPPMSHAANMGLLDMVKAIARLGAKDFHHAFDRALLQGRIETAKWLQEQGIPLLPGIIMGSCETLNVRGFTYLDDAGAQKPRAHSSL